MVHTNDEIADLIVRTTHLMLEIDSFVNTENDHDCLYRTSYKTHRLLVTKVLEKLEQLMNEQLSVNFNLRDFTEVLNDIKQVSNQVLSSKRYVPSTGTLYRQIGETDERDNREERY
jgi:hypothetical protein